MMIDTVNKTNQILVLEPDALLLAGQQANEYASENLFLDYRRRVAANTLRRQDADLALFARYLHEAGITVKDLWDNPAAWRGITWGIVAGFVEWQLRQGYAIGSINVHLTTLKVYCTLSHQAGVIDSDEYTRIKAVKGYSRKQSSKVDEKRETKRRGQKKGAAVSLNKDQADLLKVQPDTPQGRRDMLLMCLLLDHGLRCGEIAGLQVNAFDLRAATFTFHRPKVDKVQTHKLTTDALRAANAYFASDALALGPLLLGSRKSGRLEGTMSERAINDRVRVLGEAIGVQGLSPHDCRHYWATRAARQKTDPFALQEAGGWNSLAMPRRYVEEAQIANENVKL